MMAKEGAVRVTDQQVMKLLEEMRRQGQVGLASLRAGMDRKTGRKYVGLNKLPSELKKRRTWRTHRNRFDADWPDIVEMLRAAPELEAKTLFEHLMEKTPGRYQPGQLRTLQRHIKQWRAAEGPPKEVFFPQNHRPGEAAQTDFTVVKEFEVRIGGEPFPHQLCHVVLPYSNWEWATPCVSESLVALRTGVQAAFFELGRVPTWHQSDHSTAATHRVGKGWEFNEDYLALMRHLEMKPRTTGVGKKEQNGDVESSNGVLKRRMKQHLLLRGSGDFESLDAYKGWLQKVLRKANGLRSDRLAEELQVMKKLSVKRLLEYTEETVRVSSWSTIRVKRNAYSVPSRLIGEKVRVRCYEDRLAVYFAGQVQLEVERLLGRNGHQINYRHVIWSLVQKPGAFARYRYRSDLFPSLTFRQAYDSLVDAMTDRQADIEYLRVLHLAASTMESEVEAALELLLADKLVPRYDEVRALVQPTKPNVPEMAELNVNLNEYDVLLSNAMEMAS